MRIAAIISIFILCLSCTAQQKAANKIINVSSASGLQQALDYAKAGDEIVMEDGVYEGNFKIPPTANGTKNNPNSTQTKQARFNC